MASVLWHNSLIIASFEVYLDSLRALRVIVPLQLQLFVYAVEFLLVCCYISDVVWVDIEKARTIFIASQTELFVSTVVLGYLDILLAQAPALVSRQDVTIPRILY